MKSFALFPLNHIGFQVFLLVTSRFANFFAVRLTLYILMKQVRKNTQLVLIGHVSDEPFIVFIQKPE